MWNKYSDNLYNAIVDYLCGNEGSADYLSSAMREYKDNVMPTKGVDINADYIVTFNWKDGHPDCSTAKMEKMK